MIGRDPDPEFDPTNPDHVAERDRLALRIAGEITKRQFRKEKPEAEPAEQPAPKAPSKNRGGRPREHNWDAFWIEIIRKAILDGELGGRSALTKHMLEFVAAWPKPPDEREVRRKLEDLYTHKWVTP